MKVILILLSFFIFQSGAVAESELDEVNVWSAASLIAVNNINTESTNTHGICYSLGGLGQKLENLGTAGADLLIQEIGSATEETRTLAKETTELESLRMRISGFCYNPLLPVEGGVEKLDRESLKEALKLAKKKLTQFRDKYFKE